MVHGTLLCFDVISMTMDSTAFGQLWKVPGHRLPARVPWRLFDDVTVYKRRRSEVKSGESDA